MKYSIILYLLLCFCPIVQSQANIISGFIKTDKGESLANIVISDGYSVVKSDDRGAYSFARNDSAKFVFISLPSGYEIPLVDGSPQIWARLPESGNFVQNFTLKMLPNREDDNHVFVAIGDPQVRDEFEMYRFKSESLADIQKLKADYPVNTYFIGVVLGDIVWDKYHLFQQQKENLKLAGFPIFPVIGNHDHNMNTCGDIDSDDDFEAVFGPTYYSFNRGNVHYVILDNIAYKGCQSKDYTHGLSMNQVRWLKKDLEYVPEDMTISFCGHAQMNSNNVKNWDICTSYFSSRRKMQHTFAGHAHLKKNFLPSPRLYEHTVSTTNGAMWSGDWCGDGTPSGYGVFHSEGDKGYTYWYHKAVNIPKEEQIKAFHLNTATMDNKGDCIIANVWDWDPNWQVNIYENGVKKTMINYIGYDPEVYDYLYGLDRPMWPTGTQAQSAEPKNSAHMFYYKPIDPNADFEIEVISRFGEVFKKKVKKQMMTASFSEENGDWFYKQDFDKLPHYPCIFSPSAAKANYVQGHTLPGWYSCSSGALLPSADNANWEAFDHIRIGTGNHIGGYMYSFGNGDDNVSHKNSINRALGSLVTPSHRGISHGVIIENTTGTTINSLNIEYMGELWRVGTAQSASNSLSFSYKVNPDVENIRKRTKWIGEENTTLYPSLNFISPRNNTAAQSGVNNTAINGDHPDNRVKIGAKLEVILQPGETILLRWDDTDDRSDDHALAIDDLVIKANTVTNAEKKTFAQYRPFEICGMNLRFPTLPSDHMSIYASSGELRYNAIPNSTQLALDKILSSGVYIIKMGNNTEKIVIIH